MLQNIPGIAGMTLCVAGIWYLPDLAQRLITGEQRKTKRDNWDFIMENRDARIRKERKARMERLIEEERAMQKL